MSLHQDFVEEILERLPVKSLFRFKVVSKGWKMTIEAQYFKEKHMIRRQSQEPDFLVTAADGEELVASTLVLDSSNSIANVQDHQFAPEFSLNLPYNDISQICDGLVCFYQFRGYIVVVNPITTWMRQVPQASLQTLLLERCDEYEPYLLGFGKDICTKTYKLVWLYNSLELGLKGDTTCEVFDFNFNTWRHVESPPYRILDYQTPVFVDGSLHWFIYKTNTEIKVLSFDCHTEIFQVISESPITQEDENGIIICNLNNRLCVSEKKWPTQDIWTLHSSNMKWEKIYSLNLSSCPDPYLSAEMWPIACPLAILKNKKILFLDEYADNPNLVIYDLETRSYSLFDELKSVISINYPYFQSLISIS